MVSLIPYLGETGKIAKIGKAVTKVAVPLGKAFSVLGLGEAATVLTKNPKDWDTEDLLKLSAGIQSVINVGHSHHVRSGEQKLASTLQGLEGSGKRKFSRVFGTGETAKRIELSDAEISRITQAQDASQELKTILAGKGIQEADLQDPRGLLSDFGFDVKNRRAILKKNRTSEASVPKNDTPDYSKRIVFDPLGKKEIARREYIDSRLKNLTPAQKAQLLRNNDVFTRTVENGQIRYTSNDNGVAKAYRESRARINPNDPDVITS